MGALRLRLWPVLGLMLAVPFVVGNVTPAAAQQGLRAKVDRYEPVSLPDARIWVSVLRGGEPVPYDRVEQVSVYVNGTLSDDVDVESAAEHGAPRAVAAVIDARIPHEWRMARQAIAPAFEDLPDGSLAAVHGFTHGVKSLPEADDELWTAEPSLLAENLASLDMDEGGQPLLRLAVREALLRFPLAPGRSAADEPDPLPDLPEDLEFPGDRILYVIADGELVGRGSDTVSRQLKSLVGLARRRGVRIMTIGVADGLRASNLWVLEALARKTGGTFRRAPLVNTIANSVREAVDELDSRLVITADAGEVRPRDPLGFTVKVKVVGSGVRTTRDYSARAVNVLGPIDRLLDTIGDKWEGLAFWIRMVITIGAAVLVLLIVLLVVFLRLRKAAKARDAAAAERQADLAQRKPCPVCGNVMMPEWTECLFCAQQRQAQRPMRYRLVGRAGAFAGRALRFDKNLVVFGATANCDIHLPEHGVAPEHCGLRDRGDGEFLLSDFNTSGGTWVNGERITQASLSEGDVVRVGASEFVFGVES